MSNETRHPELPRSLGLRDLILLNIVAVLNLVPVTAAGEALDNTDLSHPYRKKVAKVYVARALRDLRIATEA